MKNELRKGIAMSVVLSFFAAALVAGAFAYYYQSAETNSAKENPMYRDSNMSGTNPLYENKTVAPPAGNPPPPASAGNTMPAGSGAGVSAPQKREINVEAGNFYFNPKEITISKGTAVKINLTNVSGMPHDWVLDEFNARTAKIDQGGSASVEFVADRTGTFEYYCSVGRHRQMGMVGKLIVK